MRTLSVLLCIAISLFLFVSCGPKVSASLSGTVFIEGEALAGVTVCLSNGYSTVTDEQGRYTFQPVYPGFYTITASATENGCFVFSCVKSITVGSSDSNPSNLDLKPVRNEVKEWNITVIGLEDTLDPEALFSDTPFSTDLSLNFLKRNTEGTISLICQTDSGWKTALTLKTKNFPEGIKNYLNVSKEMNPAENEILIILKKGHGWRASARLPEGRYPEDVFFEETFSTFELSKALENFHFETIISVRPYSNLVETAYQLKNNCEYYAGFEGSFPDCFGNLSSITVPITDGLSKDMPDYLNRLRDDFSTRLESYVPEMNQKKKGVAFSVIRSDLLEELAFRFSVLVDSLELLLSDMTLNMSLKMDLANTLVWQPLRFEFEDYIDLGDWVSKIKSILDGSLYDDGYAVKSREIGFEYDLNNRLVKTLIEDCDFLLENISRTVTHKFHKGYSTYYTENGFRYANKNYLNSSGIGFWYPVAVEGGLWNVFGKEFYDKLDFSKRTKWTSFLKRLLSVDILPSQVLMKKDLSGNVECDRDLYDPNSSLVTSGITLNLGFIDKSAIDKVWLVLGDIPISMEKVEAGGGAFEEDQNSYRIYYPITLEDQGKIVKARIWMKGAENSEENYAYKINDLPSGNGIAIFSASGSTLLYAVPGSTCKITPDNSLRFEIVTGKHEFSADSSVKIRMLSMDTGVEKVIVLENKSETDSSYIWSSELIKGEDIAYLGSMRTVLEFSNQDGYIKSVNEFGKENWVINISE